MPITLTKKELTETTRQRLLDCYATSNFPMQPDQFRAMARGLALACPSEVLTAKHLNRPATQLARTRLRNRQERQARAIIALGETKDHLLTHNATMTQIIEDTLTRIALAVQAGLITRETADEMEADLRRRPRRLRRVS